MKSPKIPSAIHIRKNKVPVSLRTFHDELYYEKVKKNRKNMSTSVLHVETPIKEWKYWKLINNAFPYSSVFKTHHMLVPKRVVCQNELNFEENKELEKIIARLGEEYDCQLINFQNKQSIKNHFHIHFLVYKDRRKDLKI